MSDQQVQTQEFARNPNPEIRVSCTVCKKEYLLEEMLKEELLPPPYEGVFEGYLLCPGCGDRKHSYYLTEFVRFKQTELKRALEKWNVTKSMVDWRHYVVKQKKFQAIFDAAQKRYTAPVSKETTT